MHRTLETIAHALASKDTAKHDVKEAWVEYEGSRCIKFPKDLAEFDGFVIATFIVREVIQPGVKKRAIYQGQVVTLLGTIPSLSPCFRYRLRFAPKIDREDLNRQRDLIVTEYEILPKAGFVSAERLPWNVQRLTWCIEWEMHVHAPKDVQAYMEPVFASMSEEERGSASATQIGLFGLTALKDEHVRNIPCYDRWSQVGDVFRMEYLLVAKVAWPNHMSAVRSLDSDYLQRIVEILKKDPHQLAFEGVVKQFALSELSYAGLLDVLKMWDVSSPGCYTTKRLHKGAVHLYRHLKSMRKSWAHTAFSKEHFLRYYRQEDAGSEYAGIADAALNWLVTEGHLLYVGEDGIALTDRRTWFGPDSPARYIQTPRDDEWKEKIVCHLRRICANFIVAQGKAAWRHVQDEVTAVPKGMLNAQQRKAMAHIMNNPITIVQGGPGSGKTFMCVEHLAAIFEWPEFVTHVGRQAVSLCDRLGGNTESAATIHSAHGRQKKDFVRVAYNARKQILVLDEVYNGTERELEWALSLVPEASRVVFVGDPNQIRPISDEPGAGTPALDIARAFPQHVIVLTENMRQQEGARVIHEVVENVLHKQDDRIEWESNLSPSAGTHAVRLSSPPVYNGNVEPIRESVYALIGRLRHMTDGDEHAWQIVTLYNGNKPQHQGVGCKQLNALVEDYFSRIGHFSPGRAGRERVMINKRLTMYPGYKFMFTEKSSVENAKALNAKLAPAHRGMWCDTKNGQIEVVKEIRAIRVGGFAQGAKFWLVECQPKGKCKEGVRFIINSKVHVNPSHIVSAWAITTDKSMGGECTNVGVYIPPGIEKSKFNRSNLYVGVSRPMEFLCVIGEPRDIHALTMKDPPRVNTGLQLRLAHAQLYPYEWSPALREKEILSGASSGALEEVMKHTDWKRPHDIAGRGFLNYALLEDLGLDIFDQTQRTLTSKPSTVCPESFSVFRAKMRKEVDQLTNPKERTEYARAIETRYAQRTYCFMKDSMGGHTESKVIYSGGGARQTSERVRNDNSAATKRQRVQQIADQEEDAEDDHDETPASTPQGNAFDLLMQPRDWSATVTRKSKSNPRKTMQEVQMASVPMVCTAGVNRVQLPGLSKRRKLQAEQKNFQIVPMPEVEEEEEEEEGSVGLEYETTTLINEGQEEVEQEEEVEDVEEDDDDMNNT
jgi:hypothetical protein